jgi:hypothetical protein
VQQVIQGPKVGKELKEPKVDKEPKDLRGRLALKVRQVLHHKEQQVTLDQREDKELKVLKGL